MSWSTLMTDPAPGSPEEIRSLATAWRQLASQQRVGVDDLTTQQHGVSAYWRDAPGADALTQALGITAVPIQNVAEQLDCAARALETYAAQLEQLQARGHLMTASVFAAHDRIQRDQNAMHPIQLIPVKGLSDIQRAADDLPGAMSALNAADQGLQAVAADAHTAALAAAQQIQAAADMLEGWTSARSFGAGGAPQSSLDDSAAYQRYIAAVVARRPPELPTDPKAAAAAWAAKDPALRARYIATYPALIGNTDGIPAADRDQANRLMLAADAATIRQRAGAAGYPLPDGADGADPADRQTRKRLTAILTAAGYSGAALKTAESTLATERQLGRATALGASTVELLIYQPGAFGGKGRAAISLGDVATAAHVSVIAPGMTSQVPGYLGTEVDDAAALFGARHATGKGDDAVIAYVGYDAPGTTDPNAALTIKAQVGGKRLTGDIAGIRAMQDTRAPITLIGHSYGSTTAAYAVATDHADVDAVVLIGSPGAGPAKTAADFGLPPGRVFVGAASGDPVTTEVQQEGDPRQAGGLLQRSANHVDGSGLLGGALDLTPLPLTMSGFKGFSLGADPAAAKFGASRFHAEARNKNTFDFDNHSEYFAPGSESLSNIAAIVGGNYGQVTVAPGRVESGEHYEGTDPERSHRPPR